MGLTSEQFKIRTDLYHRERAIGEAVQKVVTFVDTKVQNCTCVIHYNYGSKVSSTISYAKSSRDKGRQAAKDAAFKKLRRSI